MLSTIPIKTKKNIFNIPLGYVWAVIILSVTPTILSIFEVEISYNNYRIISFSKLTQDISTELILGRAFSTIWIIFGIAVGIFTCILTIIDYKVKKESSSLIVGLALLASSIYDMLHLLIILGAIKTSSSLDEAIYVSWVVGRMLQIIFIISAMLYYIQIRKEKFKILHKKLILMRIMGSYFAILTIIAIVFTLNITGTPSFFIQREAFFTHPFEWAIVFLVVIWAVTIMPSILKLNKGIFFQLLILTSIPAIFASLHMSIFIKNFDIAFNFAQFLRLFTYIVPLLGISLNYSRNITKQHQMNLVLDKEVKAKEKIQKDLERRQGLLQNAEKLANMGSWDLDIHTKEINFSDALYKIFGYMPNSISPSLELMINMIIPDYRSDYKDSLEDAIKNKTSFNTEYEVLWVNGERRYILAQCRYIDYDNKLIGTCLDITQLKETTQKLSQNEALLKEAEAISHNGSFEWFNGVDHFFWSEELFRIHGYSPNSIDITLNFYIQIIHSEDLDKCRKLVEKVLEDKMDFAIEYRIIRPSKEIRFVYLTAKVILNKDGNINKIIGNLQDITELKNAAILLEKTESIYKTIASNVPDSAVLMYDTNYNLILFDGPIIKDIKFEAELKDGIHIKELFSDEEYELNIEVLEKVFNGEEIQFEKDFPNDKTFMIDYRPVKNISGDIFNVMVVMHDITEIKKVQKSLELKVDELNRSNQDLEQFAYVASHDLQEPLRKIRAFGDRLQNKYSNNIAMEGLDYIKRMQNASERMQTLIDDLLTFSRVTRTDEGFVEVDLNDQILKILEDLEFTIEKKNAKIELMVNQKIIAVPGQIRQLFQNLISNAIKFTIEGVSPLVEISSKVFKGEKLGDSYESNKDYCEITIADNGIGFEQQYADKIFELFQRLHTRTEYQGTGIGLAVCKKIVEKHNGLIKVKSIQNQGTTFTVILPVKQ